MGREIKLAGFRFTKISSERQNESEGKLEIKPNINLKTIEKFKSENSKQESLKVEFTFSLEYTNLGSVSLEGKLFLLVDQKTMKDAITGWKNKNLDNEINLIILNVIMQKASLRALELEEEMGLPPHVQIPRLQLGKKEE